MSRPDDRDDLNLSEAFELARNTINALITINGGAAAAILAFYGQALTSSGTLSDQSRSAIANALTCFGGGAFLATSVLAIAYLSQLALGANYGGDARRQHSSYRIADWMRSVAIWIAISSGILFCCGAWQARNAIVEKPTPLAITKGPQAGLPALKTH